MVLVIAEAGENHCGDMELAKKLIEVSARAGADYVKFQLYDASQTAPDDPEREWFYKVQLSPAGFQELVEYSRQQGIKALCTPWDVAKARIIFDSGVRDMKIASFHIVDMELLRYINERAERVFLSTGMASLEEIDAAVAALPKIDDLYIMHCVSEYPLAPDKVNLRVMDTLRERYGSRAKIGYSDHTVGILAPLAAAARGAEVIEKHITLDKGLPGTDHILSADPGELAQMVSQIRAVETMLGSREKRLTEAEAQNQHFLRERFHH